MDKKIEPEIEEIKSIVSLLDEKNKINADSEDKKSQSTNDEEKQTEFTCQICYNEQLLHHEMPLACNCCAKTCKECFNENIKAQFDKGKTDDFTCFCGTQTLEEIFVVRNLDTKVQNSFFQYKKSKLVNTSQNLIWCSNVKCESFIDKQLQREKVLKCLNCSQKTCRKCQKPWKEESHFCTESDEQRKFKCFTLVSGVRRCPNRSCRVWIQKNKGCVHMTCSRCYHQFCWCCMGDQSTHSSSFQVFLWYPCPLIPFQSRIVVTLITLLVMLLAPLIFLLGPIIAALIASFQIPKKTCLKMKGCKKGLGYATLMLLLLPITLSIACLVSSILVPFGVIYVWYCGMNFMIRSTYNYMRSQLC